MSVFDRVNIAQPTVYSIYQCEYSYNLMVWNKIQFEMLWNDDDSL